jgi:hypothetical protein
MGLDANAVDALFAAMHEAVEQRASTVIRTDELRADLAVLESEAAAARARLAQAKAAERERVTREQLAVEAACEDARKELRALRQRIADESAPEALEHPHTRQVPASDFGMSREKILQEIDAAAARSKTRRVAVEPRLFGATVSEAARWAPWAPAEHVDPAVPDASPRTDDDGVKPDATSEVAPLKTKAFFAAILIALINMGISEIPAEISEMARWISEIHPRRLRDQPQASRRSRVGLRRWRA